MDIYLTLCNRAAKITEELNMMYPFYKFYWNVDIDTLEIKIVAKSPYVLGADLNHEKEKTNERDNITAN